MSKTFLFLLFLMFLTVNSFAQTQKFDYPKAEKSDQTDDYFGTKVADPYRWLENTDAPETRAWIDAENKLTSGYLSTLPGRDRIKARLTELWNYEKFSAPFKQGKRYFYSKNDGLQNQSVWYVADSLTDAGKVLLDPNKLSTDGTIALNGMAVSDDGNLLAYGLSSAGSDWTDWHFKDVSTGADLPDVLNNIKFSGASWTKDGKGIFYSRFPEASDATRMQAVNYYQKLYFHKLGTKQSEDRLVYERPDDKEMGIGGNVSEDGKWLIISVTKGTAPQNMVFYKDLTKADSKVVPLVDKLEADYTFVGSDNATFYFRTDKNAPTGKVVAVNIGDAKKTWRDVVPAGKETLGAVDFVNNQLVGNYLKDAYTQIRIYDLRGKLVRSVALPGIGTASGFNGKRFDTEVFYNYLSFNAPPTIYRYDLKTGKSTVFKQANVKFNPADYEVKQVFYASHDGTRVPMFITYKKGLKLDGTNPTILHGYGGFNISSTPSFSVSRVAWMEMGGVYAEANLRGGGEYGEEWHKAGTKLNKQNVFDDFIAAAEFLIAYKYTNPKRLAISGGSNGGLLVGATLNQRPELFGAALPAVGVMDMLRFQKFTIGRAWTSDYGSSEESAGQFKAIYAYSPLHNIRKGERYPAVLVTTSDHDDRVVPAHSFKYTATLQAAQGGDAPVLIRIETRAGHGAGKPTSKIIEEQADIYAFLMKNLGM